MPSCFKTCLMLLLALPCFSKDLPSYFPKCHVDDQNISECMLKAFNQMREYARSGITEIGLPALKKIVTPLTVKQNSSTANFTVNMSDYTLQGLDNYDIKDLQYNPETMTIRVQVDFETLTITGHCDVDGHVISIHVHGKGTTRHDYGPVKATFEIQGKLKKSKGIDYYDTTDVNVNLDMTDGHFNFEGLIDNNEQLNNLTVQMFNSNSKMVTKALTPAFEKIGESGIRKFMKRLTKRFPYNDILPHS